MAFAGPLAFADGVPSAGGGQGVDPIVTGIGGAPNYNITISQNVVFANTGGAPGNTINIGWTNTIHRYNIDTDDSFYAQVWNKTLGGALPFIFCPDSKATDLEFSLCRITNQPSFKQVANNTFSTSLTITETW